MKTAAQIMNKKTAVRAELDRRVPAEQGEALWRQATARLEEILARYRDIPRGVHLHTDHYIFPSAAVYLTIRDVLGPEAACQVIEDAAIKKTVPMGQKLAKLMHLPGMKGLFLRIWDPMVRRMFGPGNGFQNRFYPKRKGEYRMDILACPYFRYYTELGCPELTRISCENDNRTYGCLPGLQFIRTSTLGTGGERCDFCLKRV